MSRCQSIQIESLGTDMASFGVLEGDGYSKSYACLVAKLTSLIVPKRRRRLWVYLSSCASNFLDCSIQTACFSLLDVFCLFGPLLVMPMSVKISHVFVKPGWLEWYFFQSRTWCNVYRMAMMCYSLDTLWVEEWHSWLEALKGVLALQGDVLSLNVTDLCIEVAMVVK